MRSYLAPLAPFVPAVSPHLHIDDDVFYERGTPVITRLPRGSVQFVLTQYKDRMPSVAVWFGLTNLARPNWLVLDI